MKGKKRAMLRERFPTLRTRPLKRHGDADSAALERAFLPS
jgi:hypothetical protein